MVELLVLWILEGVYADFVDATVHARCTRLYLYSTALKQHPGRDRSVAAADQREISPSAALFMSITGSRYGLFLGCKNCLAISSAPPTYFRIAGRART